MMTLNQFITFLQNQVQQQPTYGDEIILVKEGGAVEGLVSSSRDGLLIDHDIPRHKHSHESSWDTFTSIFTLAGITVTKHWELPNNYWPDAYLKLRAENPWWLVSTVECGIIRIGWRKNVISIDWENYHWQPTDEVTKDGSSVHAHTLEKAIEYLRGLKEEARLSRDEK